MDVTSHLMAFHPILYGCHLALDGISPHNLWICHPALDGISPHNLWICHPALDGISPHNLWIGCTPQLRVSHPIIDGYITPLFDHKCTSQAQYLRISPHILRLHPTSGSPQEYTIVSLSVRPSVRPSVRLSVPASRFRNATSCSLFLIERLVIHLW